MSDFRFDKSYGWNGDRPPERRGDGKERKTPEGRAQGEPRKPRPAREQAGSGQTTKGNRPGLKRAAGDLAREDLRKGNPANRGKTVRGGHAFLEGRATVWNEGRLHDHGRRQEIDAFGRELRSEPEKSRKRGKEKEMFYTIKGTVAHMEQGFVVLDCGGVGFKCLTSLYTQRTLRAGEQGMLFTHLNVREDALDLFGFSTQSELNCFKLLTAVSGVGPKAALAILSELTPEQVALAAASGDSRALTRASGVGPKLAQRIVLELRDKVKKMTGTPLPDFAPAGVPSACGNAGNAVNALTVLGYTPSDAAAVVAKFDSALPTEELIRLSLREMGRNH